MTRPASRAWALAAALLLPACHGGEDERLPLAEPPPGGVQGPPLAPRGVAASPGNGRVDLSWGPVSGATGYHVESGFQAGGPYGWVQRDLTGPGFRHENLQNGTAYYYRVYATNLFGDSGPSTEVRALPRFESLGTIQFRAFSEIVSDRAGTVSLLVQRTGSDAGPASVTFTTSPGSALGGLDYETTSGTLTWPPGVVGDQTVVVRILERPEVETSRSFVVSLSSAFGDALLGTPSSATVTITD
jgi:hypothetical protein